MASLGYAVFASNKLDAVNIQLECGAVQLVSPYLIAGIVNAAGAESFFIGYC